MPNPNEELVIEALKTMPGLSREEIAQLTGVQKSTLKDLIPRLVSNGMIEQGSKENPNNRGRRTINSYYLTDSNKKLEPVKLVIHTETRPSPKIIAELKN